MEYYKKISIEEHMLYAKEIALKYKIFNINGNPHNSFVRAIIKEYIKDKDYEQLYYSTMKGMAKVYPFLIYHNAIKEIYNKLKINRANELKIGKTTYKFIWDIDYIKYMFN